MDLQWAFSRPVGLLKPKGSEGHESHRGHKGHGGHEGLRCVFNFQTTVSMVYALHIPGTLATYDAAQTRSFILIVMHC